MKRAEILAILVLVVGLMVCPVQLARAIPLGTAFTYQGRLIDANNIADGLYDFEFKLFNDPCTSGQLGSTIDINDLDVIEGYFTVELDFGGVFDGDARWLEIAVRPGDSNGSFNILMPRQELTPTPYSIYAENAGTDNDWMVSGYNIYSIPPGSVGIGTTSPNAKLDVAGSFLWGNSAAAQGTLGYGTHINIGSYTNYNLRLRTNNIDRMTLDTSGNIGIGTTSPSSKLHVEDNTSNDVTAMIHNLDNTGSENLYFGTSSASDAGISVFGSANVGKQGKWEFFNNKNSGHYDWITSGSVKMTLNNQGMLGIGYANPYARLFVQESGLTDPFQVRVGSSTELIVKNSGMVGVGTNLPTEKLTVRGNILIQKESDGTSVMELGEGLDYAEGFDVSGSTKIDTGSVLIIDAKNPGKLVLSNKSYDTKVAGIVAGAKGLGSGVRLGAGQFDYDVALAGRVYCNVDATETGVEPGDLLTTSATPGYAMKATNYERAQGAILGKAMERLEKGQKGQILVLVTLQ